MYTTLKNGSSGDEVKKLQTTLKNAGYDIGSSGVDGIYGAKTEAAVKAYQKANGLSVDGIAGSQTLGSLYGNNKPVTSPQVPGKTELPGFKVSDNTVALDEKLKNIENSMPGDYVEGKYDAISKEALDQYLNRDKFSYDLNGDALYQQYKDKYIQQGKMAMMDTMGQAAAMTGGFGNSYASTVGNQAYQASLENLNDIVPELHQMAYDRYSQEGQDMLSAYSLAAGEEDRAYAKHQEAVDRALKERDYITTQRNNERAWEYGLYSDKTSRDYETAMSMLSLGIMPSAEMLSSAGVSPANAQAIADKVKENEAKAITTDEYEPYEYDDEGDTPSYDGLVDVGKKGLQIGQASYYADWDAVDWEGYFAEIRQSDGPSAALEELNYFTSNGFIPEKYVGSAAIGARGSMGH